MKDIAVYSEHGTVADLHKRTERVQSQPKVRRQDYYAKQGQIGKHRVFRTNRPINRATYLFRETIQDTGSWYPANCVLRSCASANLAACATTNSCAFLPVALIRLWPRIKLQNFGTSEFQNFMNFHEG